MKSKCLYLTVLVGFFAFLWLAPVPVQAGDYTLQGTVREFRWTNPHTWIYLTVTDAAGKETEWRLEGTSLVVLARVGWRANTLKGGERIEARIAPARNGDPEGVFSQVTLLATGQVLSGGLGAPGANNVPPPPGSAGGPGYGGAPPPPAP